MTESTEAALSGETGFKVIKQFDGRKVLSTFSPISVDGFNWAIINEIDYLEEFNDTTELSKDLRLSLLSIAIILIIIAVFFILFLANIIFKPLNLITQKMNDIASGDGDLQQRLDDTGDTEISKFASGFNEFVSKIEHIVDRVAENSISLLSQSNEMIKLSATGKEKSLSQKNKISDIAKSIYNITENIDKSTEYSDNTMKVAELANKKAKEGKEATSKAVMAIEQVESEVNNTAGVLKNLESDSKSIAEILSVIDEISNQTNLLALNAAIEAARAGENGRGFAVVADEVRNLSFRIQKETHSIAETISKLQNGTGDAVNIMQLSVDKTKLGVELSIDAGQILDSVVETSSEIEAMNKEISNATKYQKDIIHSITENIEFTDSLAQEASEASTKTDIIGKDISKLAEELQELISQFSRKSEKTPRCK